MKHYITLSAVAVLAAASVQAQGLFDALTYTDQDILGTARYSSMAGAFSALGGDISAVSDNPAGLGVYRWSEAQFSINFAYNQTKSDWEGMKRKGGNYSFNANNASFVWSFADREGEKGWLANNIGFSYRRLKNFNRTYEVVGPASLNSMTDYLAGFTDGLSASTLSSLDAYTNTDVPYMSELAYRSHLIAPSSGADSLSWHSILGSDEKSTARYKAVESGYLNEYQLTYGANISNLVYWGVSFGLESLDYTRKLNYNEDFASSGSFSLQNYFHASGVGYNFKIGVIARPVSFLRIGFALHTPTFYTLKNSHYGKMDYGVAVDSVGSTDTNYTSTGSDRYSFRTPLKLQAGVGFVIGQSAIVSVDYRYTGKNYRLGSNYTSTDFTSAYEADNEDIKNYVRATHQVRLGVEGKVLDALSLRAGVAYTTPSCKDAAERLLPLNTTRTDLEYMRSNGKFGSIYAAAGIGYRYKGFAVDVAYTYRQQREEWLPYNSDITPATIKTHKHNLIASFSWKF